MTRFLYLLLISIMTAPMGAAAQAAPLVITHVTVIDATGSAPLTDRTVVIRQGRIDTIAHAAGYRRPFGSTLVDGTGRYLIPGLWDMHVHMATGSLPPYSAGPGRVADNWRYFFPMFLAHGVTGVRDMSGDLDLLVAWRNAVWGGERDGPRMVVTGWKLGDHQPVVEGAPYPVETAGDVAESVRLLKEHGADFVKVDWFEPALYPALQDAARRAGLRFVGHVSPGINAGTAARLGQHSIEHLDGLQLAASSREAALRQEYVLGPGWWRRYLIRMHLADRDDWQLDWQRRLNGTLDPARLSTLLGIFRDTDTWQVPTLTELRDIKDLPAPERDAAAQAPYTPPPRAVRQRTFFARDPAVAASTFAEEMRLVRTLHEAGLPVLAGTDTPGLRRLPGFSLADELELLVQAGFTPMEALQSATLQPARFLGTADSMGTVEPGKVADLVLLDGDPLADIANVGTVQAVVLGGKLYDRAALDGMLAGVRTLVKGWRQGR